MRYNLLHVFPHPGMHGLLGYKEVIDTLEWGLSQLGHDVTRTMNQPVQGATNLVFGGQVMSIEDLSRLPDDTVFYNMEQLAGRQKSEMGVGYKLMAKKFQVWDYSADNVEAWERFGATKPVKLVPVGYAPILTRIQPAEQDIDVLVYGQPSLERFQVFQRLSMRGFKSMFLTGVYGDLRDNLIARSKVVLNINLYRDTHIFEIVRVSYLLANKKAVVSDFNPAQPPNQVFTKGVAFALTERLDEAVQLLMDNEDIRHKLEQSGFEIISQMDVREILKTAGLGA